MTLRILRTVTRLVVVALLGAIGGTAAAAPPRGMLSVPASPRVQPWIPPTFDSLQTWAAEARVAFRNQDHDAVDSITVVPFNRVATIGHHFMANLGRRNIGAISAVESALDSLGFDTDLVGDPLLPTFVLMVIRNPFRASAHAMGLMYWFRGDRLLQQGVEFRGGGRPRMRTWWNDAPQAPYEWAIVDMPRGAGPPGFFLFRLTADGGFWRPGQFEGKGPDLGEALEAQFNDINGDGIPELVTWLEAAADTLFEPCTGCPKRLVERTYTERKYEGFELHDSRIVPTPYSIFVLFIHMLLDKNHGAATRLLENPKKLDEAIGLGWATRRAPGTWKLDEVENERWPRWLTVRFRGPRGTERYIVRFTQKDGRWIIQSWNRAATAAR